VIFKEYLGEFARLSGMYLSGSEDNHRDERGMKDMALPPSSQRVARVQQHHNNSAMFGSRYGIEFNAKKVTITISINTASTAAVPAALTG
jgi:hypothetical protein